MSDELLESEGYEEVTLRLKWKQLAVLRTVARERDMSVDQVVRTVIDHVLLDDGSAPEGSPPSADPSDADAGLPDSRSTDAADAPTGRSFFEVADGRSSPDDAAPSEPQRTDAESGSEAGDAEAASGTAASGTAASGTAASDAPSGEEQQEEHDEDVPRSKSTWQFNEVMSRLQHLNERAAASTDAGKEDNEDDEEDAGTSMFDLPDEG